MFHRWIKLLRILIIISLIWAAFAFCISAWAWQRYSDHDGACSEYVGHQSDSWQLKGDSWYMDNCDTSNEYSRWKILYEVASDSSTFDTSLIIVAALGTILFASHVGRWVVVGKLSKRKRT